ncbi:MAG: DUF58 domain-containing protein [Lachnospiraceae bacterium]|nr:DUF58 domain-containing protein [Lachnospiraceae bacterium]
MVILFIACFAGILFLLQNALYSRLWMKGVSVRLSFSKEMVETGDQASLIEVVENRKWLPLATLKVKFQCSRNLKFLDTDNSAVTDLYYRNDLFTVMPYKRITRTHKISCPQRGYFGIYGIDLVGADLFFSQEMRGHMESDTRIYVLPRQFSSSVLDSAMKKVSGEVAVRRYEIEDPFTHRGIREYEPYDEMKSINWKATAKTGELKVNVRDHTAVKSVRIFLNLQDTNILRREELLEMSISICARIVWELLNQGVQTAVYANAPDCMTGQILILEGITGGESLNAVYKSLARLDLKKETADFGESFGDKLLLDNALYTVVISPNRHEDFQSLLVSYKEKEDFAWICPSKEMDDKDIMDKLKESVIMLQEEQV